MKWTFRNIPDQNGRTAIVTGANAGIGFETARQLALKGAHVIMAVRDEDKGLVAAQRILQEDHAVSLEVEVLDLSSLNSIHRFAGAVRDRHWNIDLLINNAGVMIPPMSVTDEGFELQIGVNYIGHFVLTGLMIPLLERSENARVVTLSSLAHRRGKIDFGSFRGEKPYRAWRAYAQSKLADLLFAVELQRRLEADGSSIQSLAAHPGWTRTDLQRHAGLAEWITSLVGMKADQGALPTLRAATDPEAEGGDYYGPDGFGEIRGYPTKAKISEKALDRDLARALWKVTEEMTGVRYLSLRSRVSPPRAVENLVAA